MGYQSLGASGEFVLRNEEFEQRRRRKRRVFKFKAKLTGCNTWHTGHHRAGTRAGYKTSECIKYNGCIADKIRRRYNQTGQNTCKIHDFGGNRPHFGGKSGPPRIPGAYRFCLCGLPLLASRVPPPLAYLLPRALTCANSRRLPRCRATRANFLSPWRAVLAFGHPIDSRSPERRMALLCASAVAAARLAPRSCCPVRGWQTWALRRCVPPWWWPT